jgi:hypothetical protein
LRVHCSPAQNSTAALAPPQPSATSPVRLFLLALAVAHPLLSCSPAPLLRPLSIYPYRPSAGGRRALTAPSSLVASSASRPSAGAPHAPSSALRACASAGGRRAADQSPPPAPAQAGLRRTPAGRWRAPFLIQTYRQCEGEVSILNTAYAVLIFFF